MHADAIGGNEAVAAAGATRTGGVVVRTIGTEFTEAAAIVAHENVLARISTPGPEARPQRAWPTDTFFGNRREFAVNGDGVELQAFSERAHGRRHVVYFHRADVIAVGDLFSTETYPVIDLERGGSVQGLLAALDTIIELAIPDADHEGGTMIVPSHGYLADEFDVAEYRDMLAIVRDRVQDMLDRGLSRAEIQAARPTFDWDARYGAESGEWTTRHVRRRSRHEPRRRRSMKRHLWRSSLLFAVARGQRVTAQSARSEAPVDLTGYWVSVVSEDWPWRMHTPAQRRLREHPAQRRGEARGRSMDGGARRLCASRSALPPCCACRRACTSLGPTIRH